MYQQLGVLTELTIGTSVLVELTLTRELAQAVQLPAQIRQYVQLVSRLTAKSTAIITLTRKQYGARTEQDTGTLAAAESLILRYIHQVVKQQRIQQKLV